MILSDKTMQNEIPRKCKSFESRKQFIYFLCEGDTNISSVFEWNLFGSDMVNCNKNMMCNFNFVLYIKVHYVHSIHPFILCRAVCCFEAFLQSDWSSQ